MKVELRSLGGMDQQQIYEFEDRIRRLEMTNQNFNPDDRVRQLETANPPTTGALVRRVQILERHAENVGDLDIQQLNAMDGH